MRRKALLLAVLLWPALVRADDWSLTRPAAPPARARGTRPPPSAKPAKASEQPQRLRARYLHVLLAEPAQAFALERLLSLYRERDGNLDGLAAELAQRAVPAAQRYALWLLRGEVAAARAQRDEARAAYAQAAALRPDAAAPLRAGAELERQAGAPEQAEALLQQALQRTKQTPERAAILRELGALALDRHDYAAAESRFDALAAGAKTGVFERAEYARALAARGEHARAVDAYQKALQALRGDARVQAPLLLEMARSRLEAGGGPAALATLDRARALAPAGSGLRHEVDEALVETERRLGQLPALAARLEAEHGGGTEQSELLGRIYEELGDSARALAAFRRALGREPRRLELRERVIRILTEQGDLGQAIAEYRALLGVAPREPRYVIELAKLLMESGKRDQALALLGQTERRFPRDARILRSLFDLYTRWNEQARALAVLTALSRVEPDDPTHYVALGEQLLERGDQAGALAAWRRILEVVPDKARAHATLAGTYLDHDMPERALAEYQAAVQAQPDQVDLVRGLAETLEKLQRSGEAAERWQQVLSLSTDRAQRREARRRVVRLWGASGQLEQRTAELARAFQWPPSAQAAAGAKPDVEAGRFLAECYRTLGTGRRRVPADARYLDLSERVLSRVLELAPGDVESMLALERLRVLRGNLPGAIEVLSRLLKADPKNARSYLTRMAEHSLAIYRDDDAIGYAERLVALNPKDAKAHERLGDLYRTRQHTERAIASYERALALDENALPVAAELAELYLSRGDTDKAAALLRRVVRASPDDELVKRAARSLIQQDLGTPRLAAFEQTLLPLALGNPQRPVYRALLIELYGALAQPLIERVRGGGAAAQAAQAELRAIGQRAIKPLLEALADGDGGQRREAIDLLGHLHNEHAAAALLAAAEHGAEIPLRRRALLAAGAVAGPALAPRFAALARAPERPLRAAAAWGLARMDGAAVRVRLRALLSSNTPGVRAQALLGLGRARDAASSAAFRDALHADPSPYVRASAALALGQSGDRKAGAALTAALRTEPPQSAAAVALALGLLGDRTASEPLCEALFAGEAVVRRAALWSLRVLAAAPQSEHPTPPELPEPDERLSLSPLIESWLAREPQAPAAQALAAFARELQEAAEAALQGPPASARTALRLLSGADPLLVPPGGPRGAALEALIAALRPALLALGSHPDPALRAASIALLASAPAADAARSLTAALDDGDEQVQSAALARVGPGVGDAHIVQRVAAIAQRDARWWMRLRAVQALGRIGGESATRQLLPVLQHDAYAYVREAAAAALGSVQAAQAVPALAQTLGDPEPRVRLAAARALLAIGGPGAEQALARMDTATRAALKSTGQPRN